MFVQVTKWCSKVERQEIQWFKEGRVAVNTSHITKLVPSRGGMWKVVLTRGDTFWVDGPDAVKVMDCHGQAR